MNLGDRYLRALMAALAVALVCTEAAHANGGLNCDVAVVQFNLPASGTPADPLKPATPQIQVQCSVAPPQPGLKHPAARSTYPANGVAGQVTWGTDHHHTNSPARGGVVIHRSQAMSVGAHDHTGR